LKTLSAIIINQKSKARRMKGFQVTRHRLQPGRVSTIAAVCILIMSAELLAQLPPEMANRRQAHGADVAPVYEGWEPNKDGTVTLYFGYMSRNYEEQVDIPIGPNNSFEPAPADRGQPTHFYVNRQKKGLAIVVPATTQGLTWTLSRDGVHMNKVSGTVDPQYQIDATKADGSEGPKVNAGKAQVIVFPQSATLTGTVTSNGLPKGSGTLVGDDGQLLNAGPQGLRVNWRKYRGPGTVTFSAPSGEVKDDKAVTTAKFSEPGEYWLQLIADDGRAGGVLDQNGNPGANLCCSTSDVVVVTVKPAESQK
jgi:hypothetical protein